MGANSWKYLQTLQKKFSWFYICGVCLLWVLHPLCMYIVYDITWTYLVKVFVVCIFAVAGQSAKPRTFAPPKIPHYYPLPLESMPKKWARWIIIVMLWVCASPQFCATKSIMKRCWLFSCRQLDRKETYLADVSTGCSSPPQGESLALRRTGAPGWNVSKISFFPIKLSTREQSASFHDHRSNWEFIWQIYNIIDIRTESIFKCMCSN